MSPSGSPKWSSSVCTGWPYQCSFPNDEAKIEFLVPEASQLWSQDSHWPQSTALEPMGTWPLLFLHGALLNESGEGPSLHCIPSAQPLGSLKQT